MAPTPHLNGRHCVFGEVLEVRSTRVRRCLPRRSVLTRLRLPRLPQGYDVVEKLEKVGSQGGTPSKEALIADCGVL